ncbi:branched-chain amino acid ABC transporter permease [Afifella pfennigii]|uniref:branched-chain amino acid ABC transporter permease n=1 Tax=Afifella pfennigii TaxID=209897 RepID=UPI00068B7330|nr:branched-chain amino acid ABC transporter permease [Afifella pfennigii]
MMARLARAEMPRLRQMLFVAGAVAALEAVNRLTGVSGSLLVAEIIIMMVFASSLNLLMSFGHMVSFGHAAYFGLGSYGFALAITRFDVPAEAALVFGPLLAGIGGLVFGALCVRLTEIYFAMLTLACAQITYTVLFQWYDFTGGDTGLTGFMTPRFGLSEANFASAAMVLALVCLYVLWRVVHSPLGLAIRSVGQDRYRAEALGLSPRRVQLVAFVISAFFAGVAGTLFAVFHGNAFPDYAGLGFTLDALIMVVLGGLNSFLGGVWGALVYTLLKNFVPLMTAHWELILGLILLAIVLVMPHGLAGGVKRLAGMLGWGALR